MLIEKRDSIQERKTTMKKLMFAAAALAAGIAVADVTSANIVG